VFVHLETQPNSLYERVGGEPFFISLVERFYRGVETDPLLRPLYPADLEPPKRHLALFLVQYWGGPHTYSAERGHPRLRMRHAPFKVGPIERDAWLAADDTPTQQTIAQQLQCYVDRTAAVRAKLQTERVFLNGNNNGFWEEMAVGNCNRRLEEFVRRHRLERNETPIHLGSTLFRRTLATRALYEGLNLEALRLQLGHSTLATTLIYTQFDLFEHPAQVRGPLDTYGRQTLTTWHAPLLLHELSSDERVALLSVRVQRDQAVGIGRFDPDHDLQARLGVDVAGLQVALELANQTIGRLNGIAAALPYRY